MEPGSCQRSDGEPVLGHCLGPTSHQRRGGGTTFTVEARGVYILCTCLRPRGSFRPSHLIYTRVVASLVVVLVEDAVRRRRRVCVIQGASARESRGGGNDRYEHEHGRCDVVPSFLARREKRRIAASACMMCFNATTSSPTRPVEPTLARTRPSRPAPFAIIRRERSSTLLAFSSRCEAETERTTTNNVKRGGVSTTTSLRGSHQQQVDTGGRHPGGSPAQYTHLEEPWIALHAAVGSGL